MMCERKVKIERVDRLLGMGDIPPAGLFLLIGVRIAARVGWAFDYKGVMPAFTYRMISVNTC